MANHLEYDIREVLQDFEKRGRLKASVSDTMKKMSVKTEREPYSFKGKQYVGTTYTLHIEGRKSDLVAKSMPRKGGVRVVGHSNRKNDLREAARDMLWHEPLICHVEPGIPIYF